MTITGAPRIAEGKVLIGNGGAELGARGYVTAYNADDGSEAWRFWVVPGNPADGFENPDMEFAATTWAGEWWETAVVATHGIPLFMTRNCDWSM